MSEHRLMFIPQESSTRSRANSTLAVNSALVEVAQYALICAALLPF